MKRVASNRGLPPCSSHANPATASGARTASGGEVFIAANTKRPCESDPPIFGSSGSSESQAQHCQVAHENDLTFGSRDGRVDPRGGTRATTTARRRLRWRVAERRRSSGPRDRWPVADEGACATRFEDALFSSRIELNTLVGDGPCRHGAIVLTHALWLKTSIPARGSSLWGTPRGWARTSWQMKLLYDKTKYESSCFQRPQALETAGFYFRVSCNLDHRLGSRTNRDVATTMGHF